MSAKEIFAMTISTLNYSMKSKMKILMTKFPFTAPTNVKNSPEKLLIPGKPKLAIEKNKKNKVFMSKF